MNQTHLTFLFEEYPNLSPEQIIESLGFLFPWTMEYTTGQSDLPNFTEHMTARYGCGELYRLPGTIEDSTLKFPGDPDRAFVLKLESGPLTVLFFPYALLAWRQSPTQPYFITRMD